MRARVGHLGACGGEIVRISLRRFLRGLKLAGDAVEDLDAGGAETVRISLRRFLRGILKEACDG
jgi:hypothetical protein